LDYLKGFISVYRDFPADIGIRISICSQPKISARQQSSDFLAPLLWCHV
jgi:hypothetical protein